MAKDFAKLRSKEKCNRQDKAFRARNLFPLFFMFAFLFLTIIPFYLAAEMLRYDMDVSKIPASIVSQFAVNIITSFVVSIIFFILGLASLIVYFYYKIPENLSIALALTRIDNIKSKCSKRMTESECKNIQKPYNIIQTINFRTLSPYAKNRESLLKFNKMFRKYISKIVIYCEPSCYSSIRNDLHKVIESFKRERYGDIRELNESLWKEISGMKELSKLVKPTRFERILSNLSYANAERINNAFDIISNLVRKTVLILSAIFSIVLDSSFIWNPDLFSTLLSNPATLLVIGAPIGIYGVFIVINVFIKR